MITIQEAQWQLTEKIHGLERLEGAEAIYEWQQRQGISRRESRDHVRRIWVKDGGRFGCEECGTMPDYLGSEEHSANLLESAPYVLAGGDAAELVMFNVIPPGMGLGWAGAHKDRKTAILLGHLRRWKIEIPAELEVTA